jgi:hypothetical protein
MDDQTKAPPDLTRYDLRLDRQTIRELAAIAEREGCGIGSLIRAYCRRGIVSEPQSPKPASGGSFRDVTEIRRALDRTPF